MDMIYRLCRQSIFYVLQTLIHVSINAVGSIGPSCVAQAVER